MPQRNEELTGIALMVLAAAGVAGAQVMFKMTSLASLAGLWFAGGIAVYVVTFYLTLIAYRVGRVSVLYSISAVTFVMGTLCGVWLFDEVVDASEWVGIGLILLGVAVLGSDRPRPATESSAPVPDQPGNMAP